MIIMPTGTPDGKLFFPNKLCLSDKKIEAPSDGKKEHSQIGCAQPVNGWPARGLFLLAHGN